MQREDARLMATRPEAAPLFLWNVPPAGEWAQRGACAGRGIRTWFPRGEQAKGMPRNERQRLAEARQVCAACPVFSECLVYGLRHWRDLWGVWGGHTRTERKHLYARQRREASCNR